MISFYGHYDMTIAFQKTMQMSLVGCCLACSFDAKADETASQTFIKDLYQAHKALTDIGQPGVLKTPGLPQVFFTSKAVSKLADFGEAIHPLTGAATAKLKEIRVSPDSNPDDAIATHMVVVRGEKGLRALRFQLISENGTFKIADISGGDTGAGWSLVGAPIQTKSDSVEDIVSAQETTNTTNPANSRPSVISFKDPFVDAFDGANLSSHWQIRNEDQDRYLVENGEILFVATGIPHSLTQGNPVNEISLPGTMPGRDYRLSIQLRIEPNIMEEKAVLALRNGEDDFLAADLFVRDTGCGPELILATHNSRQIREEEKAHHTYHETRLLAGPFSPNICGEKERAQSDAVLEQLKRQGATLSLIRQGHFYRAQIDMRMTGQTLSFQSPFMVRFEPMANPTIYVGKENGNPGSGNVYVSQFEFQPQ